MLDFQGDQGLQGERGDPGRRGAEVRMQLLSLHLNKIRELLHDYQCNHTSSGAISMQGLCSGEGIIGNDQALLIKNCQVQR